MVANNINKKVQDIMFVIENIPLSCYATTNYHSFFRELLTFCEKNNLTEFHYNDIDLFMNYQRKRMDMGEINIKTYLSKRKPAWVLANYTETGVIDLSRHRYEEQRLCNEFEKVLSMFEKQILLELAGSTVESTMGMIRQFLLYLESHDCYNSSQINCTLLRDYMVQEFPKFQGSMDRHRWILRRFFDYLSQNDLLHLQVEQILTNSVAIPKKVLPCFEDNEVKKLLTVVDTTTVLGKRDYAMMSLALYLGLRTSDIMALKISDIAWKKNEIHITQSKTQTAVVLPIPSIVGNSIADYILNARPKIDNPYVFLSMVRPFDRLHKGMGRNFMLRYWKKADLPKVAWDGKSFHSFRRTLGTNMLVEGVPLTTISQTLGHKSLDSAKRYLSLHDDMLRQCCMNISIFPIEKEGLS